MRCESLPELMSTAWTRHKVSRDFLFNREGEERKKTHFQTTQR